ncbi:MAG TPA: BamA/TamA family outer membrane protein [Gemmatimonadales bacterium]|nr:BamA/TamA family outer membrane protein [Gemmatimonadales bacterium]
MRRASLALLLVCAVRPATAQDTTSAIPPALWMDVAYPKVFYTGREGLVVGGYVAYLSPMSFAEFDRPEAYRGAYSLNAELGTRGSRKVVLEARLPRLWPGWRVMASLGGERRARDNYFGLGNESVNDAANVTAAQPDYYHARDTRHALRGEVQREVAPRLRVLAGLHLERWRLDTLPGVSRLAQDRAMGADPAIGRGVWDASARVGLVYDSRDSEPAPRRGVLAEVVVSRASAAAAGDMTYTRGLASASGYWPATSRLVLAARVLGQRMWGTPLLGTFYRVDTSDRPFKGLGGGESHRALPENRLLGPDKLLANLDVRYDLVAIPTLARATMVGFLDAGRVFHNQPFQVTTTGLKVGGGAGVVLQFGRAGILGFTLGAGPDGAVAQALTRWTY